MMCSWSYVYILLLIFDLYKAYDNQCPTVSQWNYRAKIICRHSTYLCLWNQLSFTNTEFCGNEEFSRQGTKYVLSPSPQEVSCSETFYQPFMFTSIGNSHCVFKKSTCGSEGQVIVDNGKSETDRVCRCDYTRGYVYVSSPTNKCTCIPSQEDCSCYLNPCKNRSHIITKDYKCFDKGLEMRPDKLPCESLYVSLNEPHTHSAYSSDELFNTHDTFSVTVVSTVFLQILIGVLLILMVCCIYLLVKDWPLIEYKVLNSELNVFGKNDDSNYTVINGDTVTLEFRFNTELKGRSVCWTYGNKNDHGMETIIQRPLEDSHMQSLTIPNFSILNSGRYNCIVTNRKGLTNTSLEGFYNFLTSVPYLKHIFQSSFIKLRIFSYNDPNDSIEEADCANYDTKEAHLNSACELKNYKIDNQCQHTKKRRCIWIKYNTFGRTPNVVQDQTTTTTSDSVMEIKEVNLSDAGFYLCIVMTCNGEIDDHACYQVKLTVLPPKKGYEELWKHERNKAYYKNKDFSEIMETLYVEDVVIITGTTGSGKSAMCWKMALTAKRKNGFLPYKIDQFDDKIVLFDETKTFYIIDNNDFKTTDIMDLLYQIKPFADATPNLKVVVTCMPEMASELKRVISNEGHNISVLSI